MVEETLLVDGKSSSSDEEHKTMRMGLRSWRPHWLQGMNSIFWFAVMLSIASFVQVLITGMTVLNLQTIETEFGFQSRYSGLIMAGNDASALLLVMIVSFFGDKASKPKWIGVGCIITGIGVLLFALPKLLIGKYTAHYGLQSTQPLCLTRNNTIIPTSECKEGESSEMYLHVAIFFLAQFIIGAGATPLQTLGPSYLDENVSPRMSPIYLGVWFTGNMLGPPLGMMSGGLLLKTHTDIDKPENIEVNDPRWVGAWWLGYVAFAGLFIIIGAIITLFPKRMHGKQQKKREASIKAGHLPSSDERIKFTFKGYFIATFKLLTNKVLVITIMALTIRMLFSMGMITFLIKIMIVKFGVEPSKVGFMLGIALLPSIIIGISCGSLAMNRLKVELAAKTAGKICFIVSILTLANGFMFYLPGCSNTNLAGVSTPYYNRTLTESIESTCNSHCGCKENFYLPVCGSDGRVYHSPCYAGCTSYAIIMNEKTKKLEQVFGNCTCFPPKLNSNSKQMNSTPRMLPSLNNSNGFSFQSIKGLSPQQKMKYIKDLPPQAKKQFFGMMKMEIQSFFNTANIGKCDRNCKNFYVFIVLIIGMVFLSFISSTPQKIMVLRCVPDNQRSFALGIQFLIMRAISFLPGPILLGAILDSYCISWGYNKCGEKTSCHDYDIDGMSMSLVVFAVAVSVISSIFYFLAWYLYPSTADNKNENVLLENNDENQNLEM